MSGEIPSLGGENILRSGGITLDGVKRVPREFYERMTKGHLADADVLINKDGAQTGKVGLYRNQNGSPLCINEHLFLIRGNAEKIAQEFLYYTLLSSLGQNQINAQISGSAQPGLKSDFLHGIFVEIPDAISEQTKISEILLTVDQAIEQTEAFIAKQQRIKTGLIQDLLTRGIDEDGNLRSEETDEFKDSPLGRIPVEWEVKPIGRIFFIQLGKMLSKKSKTGEDPFPYIGNKNVQWERIDSSAVEWMDFSPREREKFALAPGDILVCEGGEVGRSCVWQGEISNCFYQKAVHRLRPKERYEIKLFPKFMRWAISEGVLSHFTNQTSIAHLTKEKLQALPITIQREEEQSRICRVFDCVDAPLLASENQLRKLILLKSALMQDLLTGKVSITPLLTESAVNA